MHSRGGASNETRTHDPKPASTTDRDAIAPLLFAVGTADVGLVGSWVLRPGIRVGYALEETRWLVRGTPTVQEGAWAVDATLALAVRF